MLLFHFLRYQIAISIFDIYVFLFLSFSRLYRLAYKAFLIHVQIHAERSSELGRV